MENNLLVARYENREGLLLIAGFPLTSEVIAKMPCSKRAYTPTGCEGNACGRVAIGIGSLNGVRDSLSQLTHYFFGLGVELEYRGQTAVPTQSLAEIEIIQKPAQLCGLVIQTMEREARGELNLGNLKEIDYKAVYDKLFVPPEPA